MAPYHDYIEENEAHVTGTGHELGKQHRAYNSLHLRYVSVIKCIQRTPLNIQFVYYCPKCGNCKHYL